MVELPINMSAAKSFFCSSCYKHYKHFQYSFWNFQNHTREEVQNLVAAYRYGQFTMGKLCHLSSSLFSSKMLQKEEFAFPISVLAWKGNCSTAFMRMTHAFPWINFLIGAIKTLLLLPPFHIVRSFSLFIPCLDPLTSIGI